MKPLLGVSEMFRAAVILWRDRDLAVREVDNLPGHAARWIEEIDEGLHEASVLAASLECDVEDLQKCLCGEDEFTLARREILIERTLAAVHSLREGLACAVMVGLCLWGVFHSSPGSDEFVRRGGRDAARIVRVVSVRGRKREEAA